MSSSTLRTSAVTFPRHFSFSGSLFFRNVLGAYDLHPQDLAPNYVLNICNFQVFGEVYLQRKPNLLLFSEFFMGENKTTIVEVHFWSVEESLFKSAKFACILQ